MKKTLAVAAVLAAFAGSAAADVTVYGRIDTGFAYDQTTVDNFAKNNVVDTDSFSMDSGNNTGSRIGIKGSEKISENLTVGFVLEKGFKGDTGKAGDTEKTFDREATVFMNTAYGKFAAGRMGTLWSDSGSFGTFAAIAGVDGTGHGGLGISGVGLTQLNAGRYDNTVAYASPKFGGAQLFAQYAMGEDGKENKSGSDRYASVAATYTAGAMKLAAVVEQINEAGSKEDDTLGVHVGGQYDFGVAKASLAVSYFKDADDVAGIIDMYSTSVTTTSGTLTYAADNVDGYGVMAGVSAPVLGGTFTVSAGYVDAEAEGSFDLYGYSIAKDADLKAYNVGVYYDYMLSKNFKVYTGAGYTKSEFDGADYADAEKEAISVGAGVVCYF